MSYMIDSRGRSDEQRKELRAKMERLNEVARLNWDNPTWRREMAQEMTETIYLGFDHENLLSLMTTVENLPFEGRSFIKEVRGLRAFWMARGGYIEASSLTSEVMEIPRDIVGFHVYEFEDKLRVNFAETQSNLIDLGIRRMDAEVNKAFLKTLQAAVPSSHASYVSASGLALASLNTAIREVQDESRTQEVAIIGRSTMTGLIVDAIMGASSNGAGYLPETNEALLRRGVIGIYRGARIVTLTNFKDESDVPFFPANEVWVVSTDASKAAFFGDMQSKEWEEQMNWYWHYQAKREFGMVVHRPERLRRIINTAIAA